MSAASSDSIWREVAIVVGMVLLTLTLPVAVYAYLSWRTFDYLSLSYFIPHEAMRAELAHPTLAKLPSLSLVEINMTSGHILANMYTLTLGQLVLSLALGLVMGLVLAGQLGLRRICAARGRHGAGMAAGAGAGLLATIAAASTGLLGCCGGAALAGGVFALAGLGSSAAAPLAKASPLIQLALILVFVALYARVQRRRAELEAP
jgi:hypothetical protein